MSDEQRIIRCALHLAGALRQLARGNVYEAGRLSGLAWQCTWGFADDAIAERSQILCRALDAIGSQR